MTQQDKADCRQCADATRDRGLLDPPALTCFRTEPDPPRLVAAASERGWMNGTAERFAYRCTPMTIANASGWEILSPCELQVTWTGSPHKEGILIAARDERAIRLACSHFGHGILTFHTGYLFRTPPGWAIWARGSPNTIKDALVPLDGLVETDWLPFPFTMNWRFTRPTTIRFEKDEPICFITLMPHGLIDDVVPILRDLRDDSGLEAACKAWGDDRAQFNERLLRADEQTVRQGWEKAYIRGGRHEVTASPFHRSKRRLPSPIVSDADQPQSDTSLSGFRSVASEKAS